jgi:ABC-type nickel/cobalt efflux system permease component RcnA
VRDPSKREVLGGLAVLLLGVATVVYLQGAASGLALMGGSLLALIVYAATFWVLVRGSSNRDSNRRESARAPGE